eukprot:scaffold191794_cov17-Prasinocladus_malaysianus.AAC.3
MHAMRPTAPTYHATPAGPAESMRRRLHAASGAAGAATAGLAGSFAITRLDPTVPPHVLEGPSDTSVSQVPPTEDDRSIRDVVIRQRVKSTSSIPWPEVRLAYSFAPRTDH